MGKSKTDHAVALIKAGLSASPVFGGSIASLISDYLPLAIERSVGRAIEQFGYRLNELASRPR